MGNQSWGRNGYCDDDGVWHSGAFVPDYRQSLAVPMCDRRQVHGNDRCGRQATFKITLTNGVEAMSCDACLPVFLRGVPTCTVESLASQSERGR